MLRHGAISLGLRTRQAHVVDRGVELIERFTLLETLLRHPGQVLSREQLVSHVWGYDYDPGSNIVDVYVGYLRKKMAGRPSHHPRHGLSPGGGAVTPRRVLLVKDEPRIPLRRADRSLAPSGHDPGRPPTPWPLPPRPGGRGTAHRRRRRVGVPHLEHPTKEALRAAFASWTDDHAAASVLRAHSSWSSFFDFLVAEDLARGNPMAAVGKPQREAGAPRAIRDPERRRSAVGHRSPG